MQLPNHPIISLQLTPTFDDHGVSGLYVVFRIQNPLAEARQPMFSFWPFQNNVPGHLFRERDIDASDDAGPLHVRFRDVPNEGRNTQQHWLFERETHGDVILKFHVSPREVDETTPLGARIDLRRDLGGVHGAGQWFLPLLLSDKLHTNVVKWVVPPGAPASTRCVWSFGEGTKPMVRVGRADTTWNTVYMVGPVRSHPEVGSVGEEEAATTYWFGQLLPNLDRLKGYNSALFPKLADFFGSFGETYRIFVRKSPVGFGGTGFEGSYVLECCDASAEETDDSLVLLFTHEMVHSFAGMSPEEDGYENEWFIEGIAEFYSVYLPYRFGFRDRDFLIRTINGRLQSYFTSPRIAMDIRNAADEMFNDWYAELISYNRGFAYALFLDLYLRKMYGVCDISRTMATIGTLQRITADKLSTLLLAEQAAANPSVAVIDVRDDDYLGGHIKGGINMPSRSLDAMMPTLVRRLEGKKTVVFHCALSQQRGPSAALRYLRERDQILSSKKPADGSSEQAVAAEPQTVYVLDRGFVGWQEVFGDDERLTEGYRKELWKDGYWL
ncbi:CDC25-like phosphatase YCH1 [Colletotrichum spinosum]|uniref:CDC25-like phosphatase YCH1 n=1 Tax=Colletotrichum spinosum TaxID=1347390 RepID=A0A4R8QVT5_9PEZI|nr:CDC25-like phosphatase YCH1 [Colletotrichum spinosum]